MPTTTNFGWTTPADTDLVSQGASAIRTLGSAIDTSMAKLKDGAAGKVLAKASATDMDFTWVNSGWITLSTTAVVAGNNSTTTAAFSTDYSDLRIIIKDLTATSSGTLTIYAGSGGTIDTGSTYHLGSSTGGNSGAVILGTATIGSSNPTQAIIEIPNYADTVPDVKFMTVRAMRNDGSANSGLISVGWRAGANAMDIFRITTATSSYAAGSIIVQARY